MYTTLRKLGKMSVVMRNPRKVFLCFTVLGLLSFCPTDAASVQTAEQIAESALAATVYLEMTDINGKTLGFGSGFFVGQHQIATNFHVIEGAARGTAKQVGKSAKYNIEGISAADEKNDLAIVKVTAFGVEPLPLGDSDTLKVGETVYVAGNPKGLEGTFSNGIISSLGKADARSRIQMTAPISPGSSGGPVLNRNGEVIGVSSMIIEGGQNLNFAIPSNYLKALLKQVEPVKPFPGGTISAETYFHRGYVNGELGNYDDAIAAYTQAIRLKPDNAHAYYNRGNAKRKLGQHRAAITDYDTAIRLQPDYASAYNNRGNVKAELGEHIAAIADFDTAIRLKPDDAAAYYNRGISKANLGEQLTAIADYDLAISLKLDYAGAYFNRGCAKHDLGQHRAAIADYDTAIRLKPNHVFAYFNRGVAKDELGQHRAAIADYDLAINLKPNYADAYYNRGIAKYRLEQHHAAIADYDTAIRLKPDHAAIYVNRGVAKCKLGQRRAAITDYDLAIRLKPDDADAYLNRGIAKYLLYSTSEAKQDVRTALRLANRSGDTSLKAKAEKVLKLID